MSYTQNPSNRVDFITRTQYISTLRTARGCSRYQYIYIYIYIIKRDYDLIKYATDRVRPIRNWFHRTSKQTDFQPY